MPAYVVVMVTVQDPDIYRDYTAKAPATIRGHGGTYLARGGTVRTLEGEPYEGRLVLLEFPTVDAAISWFADPEYQTAAQYRRASSTTRLLVVEGLGTI